MSKQFTCPHCGATGAGLNQRAITIGQYKWDEVKEKYVYVDKESYSTDIVECDECFGIIPNLKTVTELNN